MRWFGRESSGNVEDRRGFGGGTLAIGGGIGTVIMVVISMLFGVNPLQYLSNVTNKQQEQQVATSTTPEQDNQAKFVSVVLKDTEDVWDEIFQSQYNESYSKPKLVLFTQSIESGCGSASVSSGPFYCPLDSKLYIDLSFYDDLQRRFQAPGDFAMAYVVAHEVGHHIQNLLGTMEKVRGMQEGKSEAEINALSVKLELQADFYAGVWAHHAQKMKKILEPGDIEEALTAANAIGDDLLQKQSQGYVVPDAFTHGTSKQRMFWFKKGYQTGDVNQADTFASNNAGM